MSTTLEKIITGKKMPILFIGSGLSKRYLHDYPNWEELLELSFKKINSDPFYYQKHKDLLKRQNLSDFEIYTELASIVENEFNTAFYDRKITFNMGNKKNPNWVKKGISPYKMFLCSIFKKMKIHKSNQIISEIEKLKLLKNKISAVITTNYDSFIETEIFSSDYKVFVQQNQLFSSDSYNIAEIYKIHGSVSDANSILITKQDYDKFNDSRKLLIAKMLTLFAESPIVFLGYSFTDENIQSIITEFLGCLTSNELKNIDEHFIFISYKKHEKNLNEIKRTIITPSGAEIPITEIETDNFAAVYDILNQLVPGISPLRIRETKKVVKTIVDQSITSTSAESIIVGIDDLANVDLSLKPLAIAIGYRENILNKFGYGVFSDELILEDIIFDNKHFNAESMCIDRFKSLASTRLVPVFKYIKAYNHPIPEDSKLYVYMEKHNTVDKIISKKIIKNLKNIPTIDNFDELKKVIESIDDLNKKAGILLKNISNFNLEQIRTLCGELFNYDEKSVNFSTNFKRCVMYLDLHENYLNK
ncbi:MAG: SIR2 family protein [Candidatus Galacturonibacter soehngenii]|nr:SIR2 family protein [Candidatus Galacturonibacter soehngenii]